MSAIKKKNACVQTYEKKTEISRALGLTCVNSYLRQKLKELHFRKKNSFAYFFTWSKNPVRLNLTCVSYVRTIELSLTKEK